MSLRPGMLLAVAALAVAAPLPAMAGAGSPVTIDIQDMAFGAAPAGLQVGETLRFHNDDVFEHSATAAGAFDLDLKPGESGTVILRHEGPLDVVCRFHPTMKLHLEVHARTVAAPSPRTEAPQ